MVGNELNAALVEFAEVISGLRALEGEIDDG